MREKDEQIFRAYLRVLPKLNDLTTSDVGVSLTDLEKYLLYKPGKTLDLKVKPGDPVKEGSAVHRAMTERRRVVVKVDRVLFGQPCIAVAVPLYNDDGELIGAVCLQETVDRQETLKQIAAALTDNISVLASTSEEISAQAEEIASMSKSMSQVTTESAKRVRETEQILSLIRNVAQQTNLLGLNAAIEAARVGTEGRGFGVVADEIRKLAADSTSSIKKIENIIQNVQKDANHTCNQIGQISEAIEQVAGAITHMATAIQEFSLMAQKLDKLAEELAGGAQ